MLAALLLLAQSHSILLKHAYSAHQTAGYGVTVTIDSTNYSLGGHLSVVTTAVTAEGSADLVLTQSEVEMQVNGANVPPDKPSPIKLTLDPFGFPKKFAQTEKDLFCATLIVSSVLPDQQLAIGESASLAWKGEGGIGAITGTVKLVDIKIEGNKRIAILKKSLSVQPAGENAAKFEVTTQMDAKTGEVLRSEGTIAIEDKKGRFRMTPEKI